MKVPVALAQFNGYHPKDMMELDHYEYKAITDTLYNATKKSDGTVYKIEIMPLQQMCCDPSDCMLFCKKCPVVEKSRICLHRIRYWFPMFLYHKIVTYIERMIKSFKKSLRYSLVVTNRLISFYFGGSLF